MRRDNRLLNALRIIYWGAVIHRSGLFDADFYLKHNQDVANAKVIPLWHFLRHGAQEGRSPSTQFDVRFYLKEYPDVKASGVNPLYHYIKHGKAEGRKPRAVAASLTTSTISACDSATFIFDHGCGGGTWRYVYSSLLDPSAPISRTLLARFIPGSGCFNVEVRQDTRVIEKASYEEEAAFLTDIGKIKYSTIIVNHLIFWPSTRRILNWIAKYKEANPSVRVEFKGHDFYSICPSHVLLDHQRQYCGIRCDETECNDCIKQLGTNHVYLDEDNREFFSVSGWRQMWNTFWVNTADVVEVFSASSQKIFLQAYPDISEKIKLVPHKIQSFGCCRIAVLGILAVQKGSEVIRELCYYLDENQIEDMQLYLFGDNPEGVFSSHLQIMGTYKRNELPEKLKAAKIDAVFIPSIWPETFCYTAGESIALGYPTACFDMGGQADQVRQTDNGLILYNEKPEYLYHMLKSLAGVEEKQSGEQENTGEHTRTVVVQDTMSRDFLKWMYAQRDDKNQFVEEAKDAIQMRPDMPKIIAAYLPQFHDFPENVRWFGKGFSEWTNTTQTLPQFIGHRQPQVPIDVGYYNLDHTDAMYRQAELAKKYGIAGFCVYYYWFSGVKLMDQPLKRILEDPNLDFPFFLFWANEDWTKLWGNGAYRETLYKFEMRPEDAEKFMEDALPYMRDSRYMKIDNKPILVIYKVKLCKKSEYDAFIERIQEIARENGFDGIYLLATVDVFMNLEKLEDVQKEYKLNALVEFHPLARRKGWNLKQEDFFDPACQSLCYDVDDFVSNRKYLLDTRAKVFPGLFTNWDNSPRRYHRGAFILQSTPEKYKKWLADLIAWTHKHNKPNERFILVNAWNEWAEGAHLEPDSYYGYAYLQKTREALEESKPD